MDSNKSITLISNMDIGLYPDGKQNSFESNIAINYIIDIIEIVLNSIEIFFALRIKKGLETPIQIVKISQNPRPQLQPKFKVVEKEIVVRQVEILVHPLDNIYE